MSIYSLRPFIPFLSGQFNLFLSRPFSPFLSCPLILVYFLSTHDFRQRIWQSKRRLQLVLFFSRLKGCTSFLCPSRSHQLPVTPPPLPHWQRPWIGPFPTRRVGKYTLLVLVQSRQRDSPSTLGSRVGFTGLCIQTAHVQYSPVVTVG